MGWFESSKKLNLPGFVVNAFGKLPFYKEYLYLCPDPAFADLKAWVDDRFERLSRQGTEPPYLAPNRHFMIHVPGHKVDLAGSIWESNDGMRTFPFMLAKALPRKARKHGFPLFWQCLVSVWDYFERYYDHLRETNSSSAFYKGIRGVVHQIPKVLGPDWPKNAPLNEEARSDLERGGLARFDLRSDSPDLTTWLGGLQLKQCPNLILWPQSDYATKPYRAMGYMSMLAIEALAIDLFQPKPLEGDALREANALAHGAAIAAQVDAHVTEEDTSEDVTLILGGKNKPDLDSQPQGMPIVESSEDALQDGQSTLNLPPLSEEMDTIQHGDETSVAEPKATAEEHVKADVERSELPTEKMHVSDLPVEDEAPVSVELPEPALDEQQTEKVDLVQLGLVDEEKHELHPPEHQVSVESPPPEELRTETLEVVELAQSEGAGKDFEATTLSEVSIDEAEDESPTQSLEKFDLPEGFGDSRDLDEKPPERFEKVSLTSADPQADIDTSEDVTQVLQGAMEELGDEPDQDQITVEGTEEPETLPDGVPLMHLSDQQPPKLEGGKPSSNRVVEELLTLDPEFRHPQSAADTQDDVDN